MGLGRNVAVILAGAVAKGAFEAGALKVLASKLAASDGRIVRIVAASSGALNGTLLAAAAHAGNLLEGTAQLANLWVREGSLFHAFHLNLGDIFRLEGLSDQRQLLELLSSNVKPRLEGSDVELRIIVTALRGVAGNIGSDPATTYERVFRFTKASFESQAGLNEVFRAAAASASFPFAFAPMDLGPEVGPCVDGGSVNNVPIKHALEDSSADTVVVIGATVEDATAAPPGDASGVNLAGRVADILINERLYRDLREAEDVNAALTKLEALGLSADTLTRVKSALGWAQRRAISIIRIRPLEPLPGSAFQGFVSTSLRERYIALGEERARAIL